MPVFKDNNLLSTKQVLRYLILSGFLVGVILVFLVPPWMHYDEPGHFEYAWLIANRPGWPEKGDYVQSMRREFGASWNAHNFERDRSVYIDITRVDEPINIITPQTGGEPLYYALASIPLFFFRHIDLETQLYVARMVSLGLFLITIFIAYQICQVLFGKGHPLTWMVPVFLLTLPSFVDIMTAVNSDVGAVVVYSLFVWISVVLIKRGISLARLLLLGLVLVLCFFTKTTTWLAIPLSMLVLLLSLLRGHRYERAIWLSLALPAVVGIVSIFSVQRTIPAFYYSNRYRINPLRIKTETAVVGDHVIAQEGQEFHWYRYYQLIPPNDWAELAGETVTLGAWIWADKPAELQFPRIWDRNSQERHVFTNTPITLSTSPEFFAFNTELPGTFGGISWVEFRPVTDQENKVYWDGIVLTTGDFTDSPPPSFDDPSATSGEWEGLPFRNFIRNGSGGTGWPGFSSWFQNIVASRYNFTAANLFSVFDFQATSWYFSRSSHQVFRTFWGVFGWGAVFLLGSKPYRFFIGFTMVLFSGLLISIIKRYFKLSWHIYLFLAGSVILQFIMVLYRGTGSWFSRVFIPDARYAFPTIIPISILLVGGAYGLIEYINQKRKIPKEILFSIYIVLMFGILIWGIASMAVFYHGT